jgi:hypothetical protein
MEMMKASGLEGAAKEIIIGVNGGEESWNMAAVMCPAKARFVMHGLRSRSENLTIVEIEKWLPEHPDWYVCYFHCKGGSHPAGSPYGEGTAKPWRIGMMHKVVRDWRLCVDALEEGYESAGAHYLRHACDGSHNYWPGNFWWAKASFLLTLPSIFERERIKMSGIETVESRYEAEVWLGNGPRMPSVKEFLPNGGFGVP